MTKELALIQGPPGTGKVRAQQQAHRLKLLSKHHP
jgi:hypothetical protein